MTTEQLLRSAVSKLGPIAAANALTAFETGERENFNSCALARAYGADGELAKAATVEGGFLSVSRVAKLLGLAFDEACHIIWAFDESVNGYDRVLLRPLLEQEAAKLTTVPSPARGSAERSDAAPDSRALVSR